MVCLFWKCIYIFTYRWKVFFLATNIFLNVINIFFLYWEKWYGCKMLQIIKIIPMLRDPPPENLKKIKINSFLFINILEKFHLFLVDYIELSNLSYLKFFKWSHSERDEKKSTWISEREIMKLEIIENNEIIKSRRPNTKEFMYEHQVFLSNANNFHIEV